MVSSLRQLLINNLFAVSQECGDVCFGVARWRYAFSHYVADGHLVANVKVPRDNVPAVELVANDSRTDGVTVEADEQVEKCGSVAYLDVARTVEIDGRKWFFGEVERVEVALFVG